MQVAQQPADGFETPEKRGKLSLRIKSMTVTKCVIMAFVEELEFPYATWHTRSRSEAGEQLAGTASSVGHVPALSRMLEGQTARLRLAALHSPDSHRHACSLAKRLPHRQPQIAEPCKPLRSHCCSARAETHAKVVRFGSFGAV